MEQEYNLGCAENLEMLLTKVTSVQHLALAEIQLSFVHITLPGEEETGKKTLWCMKKVWSVWEMMFVQVCVHDHM
jgi:hypothetical protein